MSRKVVVTCDCCGAECIGNSDPSVEIGPFGRDYGRMIRVTVSFDQPDLPSWTEVDLCRRCKDRLVHKAASVWSRPSFGCFEKLFLEELT